MLYFEVKNTLREELLESISKDRNDEAINREAIKKVIQFYVGVGLRRAEVIKVQAAYIWQGERKLDIYEAEFEQHFLA